MACYYDAYYIACLLPAQPLSVELLNASLIHTNLLMCFPNEAKRRRQRKKKTDPACDRESKERTCEEAAVVDVDMCTVRCGRVELLWE